MNSLDQIENSQNRKSLSKENMPQIQLSAVGILKNNFKELQNNNLKFEQIKLLQENTHQKQKLKNQLLQQIDEDRKLTVQKYRAYLLKTHPKETDLGHENESLNNWSILIDIGSLFGFVCCKKRKIKDFNKNIGLSSSLFLLSLKSYIILFFILSILSIPACVVLFSGTELSSQQLGQNSGNILAKTSIANIPMDNTYSCASFNLAKFESSLNLTCPYGTMSRLVSVGMNKFKNQQICNNDTALRSAAIQYSNNTVQILGPLDQLSINKLQTNQTNKIIQNYVDFNQVCNSYLSTIFQQSYAVQNLSLNFNNLCKNNGNCSINFDYTQLNDPKCTDELLKRAYASQFNKFYKEYDHKLMNPATFDMTQIEKYDASVPDPIIYAISECKKSNLKIQGLNFELSKSNLVTFLVASDIIIFTILLIGFNIIYHMQKDFAEQFNGTILRPQDYTLKIDDLPPSFRQYTDEISLKAALSEAILKICSKIKSSDSQKLMNEDYQIVQINIIYNDNNLNAFDKLDEQCNQFQEFYGELLGYQMDDQSSQKIQCLEKINSLKSTISKCQEQVQLDIKNIFKKNAFKLQDDGQVENIAQFNINEQFDLFKRIKCIYITFNCVETKNEIEKYFFVNNHKNFLRIGNCVEKEKYLLDLNKKQNKNKKEIEFGQIYIAQDVDLIEDNQSPDFNILLLENIIDNEDDEVCLKTVQYQPQSYISQNISYDYKTKYIRLALTLAVLFVFFIILVFSLYGFQVNIIQQQSISNNGNLQSLQFKYETYTCTSNYTMYDVFNNVIKPQSMQSNEITNCFCSQQYQMLSFNQFYSINFDDFAKQINQTNSTQLNLPKYCNIWFQQSLFYKAQVYAPSLIVVFLINLIGLPLSKFVLKYYKLMNENHLVYVWFLYNYVMIYFSISTVLTLFVAPNPIIDLTNFSFKMNLNVFLSNQWYLNVNSSLGVAMALQICIFYLQQIGFYVCKMCLQVKDRNLSSYSNKDLKIGEEPKNNQLNLINSKCKSQQAYNKLNSGSKMDIGLSQAQILGMISICITYCGSMPILYVVCLIFLIIFYWYHKIFILKFFRLSLQLEQNIIIWSYKVLILGFTAHLAMTLVTVRDSPNLVSLQNAQSNFNNTQTSSNIIQQVYTPPESNIYAVYIILLSIAYVFNKLVINPITCIFLNGCCVQVDKQEKYKIFQSDNLNSDQKVRNSKYLQAVQVKNQQKTESNDIECTTLNGHENTPFQVKLNQEQSYQENQNLSKNKQKIVKFGIDINKWGQLLYKQRNNNKLKSGNTFIQEVTFDTLIVLLKDTTNDLVMCQKRINLYFRISNINENSKINQYFSEKIEKIEKYQNQLIQNKQLIELEIDNYWEFIVKNIDKNAEDALLLNLDMQDEQRSRNYRNNLKKSIVSNDQFSILKSDKSYVQIENQSYQQKTEALVNLTTDAKILQKYEQMNIDIKIASDKEEDKIETKPIYLNNQELSQTLNKLFLNKWMDIKLENIQEEIKVYDQIQERLAKLEYMKDNYEEEWLRVNYLQNRFRCVSNSYGPQTYNITNSVKDIQLALLKSQILTTDQDILSKIKIDN